MNVREVRNASSIVCVAVGMALAPVIAHAGDVFSDAKSWHQGFVDVNGDGYLNIGTGKMEFPESLLIADTANAAHTVTFGPLKYSKEISGVHTGVVLRTENVVNPYTKVSWSETVGYFPQDSDVDSNSYWTAGVFPNAPFTVSMDEECTFFLRFRWDGTFPVPSKGFNFFAAGNTEAYGFQMSISTGARYGIYSKTIIGSKTWDGASDATLAADKWTDFAITVSNRHVKVYSIQEGEKDISIMTADGGASNPSGSASSTIILGLAMEGAFDWNSGLTTAARATAFRGSIHSYAAWNRALSADEVRQVFAWPGTDLVKLGTANNSAQEFEGGAAPTTINFNVAAKDAGLPQVLRVSATSASAAGTFNVSVNGTVAGSLSVTPGKTATLYMKKNLTVAGANTLTLTRTSADAVTIDAIAIGGSIQLGNADGSFAEFAPETYGGKVFADVKTLHRGAIPWHGDNWAFNVTSANPEFPESLDGNTASLAHKVAFNSPAEGADRSFTSKDGHYGILVRTENVVYPYAKRAESTKALYFPQDTQDVGDGKYKYWTAGLHLNTNNVPFVPKYDAANESCTFFLRFRWDGTVPIPGKPSYILGVGDTTGGTYGFSVSVLESGRYNIYSGKPNLSKTWNGEGDAVIAPNKWTDFAITLSNRKITIYSYQEGSSDIVVMSGTAAGASPTSYSACNSFVIGHGRSGLAGDTWTGAQGRAYGFRGSIHSFAAWDRALSADEIRQVFAWPGERTVANLGVINDSNAEFGGTGTGFTAGTVSGAVDWFNMRGTFTSSMSSLNLSNIPLSADDFAMGLTLRFATTSASDVGSFDVYVNNALASSLSSVPGGIVTLALDKRFFFVGNNRIELRFVSASGTVYTDAIQLLRTESGDYYATASDQSDCAFGRYEIENGVETRHPTSIHVEVPDAIAGHSEYSVSVIVRFKATGAQTLALTANGAAEPVATFSAAASDAFQEFKADVPAEMLHAGDNVLTLSNAAQAGGSTWLGVDYFRVEAIHHVGTQLIIR